MLKVDPDKCTACLICQKTCPFGAIDPDGEAVSANENCVLCGACLNVCPAGALSIDRRQPSPEELAAYSGVFVFGECRAENGGLRFRRVVFELLSQARRLADRLGQDLAVVVPGDARPEHLDDLGRHGADLVLLCRHPLLQHYATDSFTNVVSAVIAKFKPSIFLYGATPNGRDLAPRVAARLKLGLTADCTGLDIDGEGQLIQTRPAFGGNIMASIVSPYSRPQTATVRPNVFTPADPVPGRAARLEEFPVNLSKAAVRTKVVERIEAAGTGGANIQEARVLVSAGRGCRDPRNLVQVRELAEELGGLMAGSRAVVELGWLPSQLQVGQSGRTVSPDLYLALGISGAVQHTVGMSSSKKVVAINLDPEAPIFKLADLGVVGDALEILPRLIEKIKQAKQGG